MELACLDSFYEIIGVDAQQRDCFPADAPSGSLTGYYMTDVQDGFNFVETVWASSARDDNSIWDIMVRIRKQACHDFLSALTIAIHQKHGQRFEAFGGLVGKNEVSSFVSLNPYFGVELCARNWRGSYCRINQIGIALNTTLTNVKAYIVKVADGNATVIHTIENLESEAGRMKYNTLATPLDLPMSDVCEKLEYRILIEKQDGITASKTRLTCCGGREKWLTFFDAHGVQGSTNTGDVVTDASSFISLNVQAFCAGLDWLCNFDEIEGYEVFKIIGKAVQMRATSLLCSYVLESPNFNRFTIMERSAVVIKGNEKQARFMDYCMWLADNLPEGVTDCFKCKTNITSSSILV